MRVPLFWLDEFCRSGLDSQRLAERLALTGTEVERVCQHGVPDTDHFVVGKVLKAEKHPDADRLTVCQVDVGEDEPSQIVCGAPNVSAGLTVAVARPGAIMPSGTTLGKAKLRGVASAGMILSEPEVGLSVDSDGTIMELQTDVPPGTPLADVLPISSEVLELEITPNRPDCLGIYGVAREVHAATGAELKTAPWSEDPGSLGALEGFSVSVEDTDICPRFTARLFENVTVGPSPTWLKARLTAAGQRPISNVVDITNYVMLLTGQPMHAFDADLVKGSRLVVRRTGEAEKVTTLDNIERELAAEMAAIYDDEGATSIAGIMGGARSEVSQSTSRVLMEAANWDGPYIQRASTALGLRSEASGRFEKQLSPEQPLEAQVVATMLMQELCGATVLPGTLDVIDGVDLSEASADAKRAGLPNHGETILLRDARIERLLGVAISRKESAEILRALEFEVEEVSEGLSVRVPHFRQFDVTRESDLIEEVARIWGLDRLPTTLPANRQGSGVLSRGQKLRRRAEDALVGAGCFEAVGWSFTSPEQVDRLNLPQADSRYQAVPLSNPMSQEQSVMRTTLLGSLLDVAARNQAHGAQEVQIFEYGAVYWQPAQKRDDGLPTEEHHLGAILTGPIRRGSWNDSRPPVSDFYTAKALVKVLLDALRVPWSVEPSNQPFLHPGRSASVVVSGRSAGWLGEVHPLVSRTWDLDQVAGFELDFDALVDAALETPEFQDVTGFPSVKQDIAIVVSDQLPARTVLDTVKAAGKPILLEAEVFDVYRGGQIQEGHHSLALRLEFGSSERTLTDAEVAKQREKISKALSQDLNATIRG